MVFVRIKRISGKEYAYLVTNSWTGSGPRQKVAKYLGKVRRPSKAKSEDLKAFLGLTSDSEIHGWVMKNSFREIAETLIKWELGNHDLGSQSIEFLDEKGKPLVLAINDGYLCSHTAKKLLEYDASTDYTGYNLADALTAAGVNVNKEVFISLFGKMQATTKTIKDAVQDNKDFYY